MTWQTKKLGEICDILDNKRKPVTKRDRTQGIYPYYGATGIQDYVSNYIFNEKLVLIGEDGAKWESGVYTAFSAEGKYWVNNHAHVIRPHRNIIMDNWLIFLFYLTDLTKYTTGLTVPKLNQENLRSILIPLPPLSEQQRIVKILDEVFEKITMVKENTKINLQNTKDLFESYLQNMFTIKGENWKAGVLKDLTLKIGSGATPRGGKESYKKEGVSLIRSMNVYDRRFTDKNLAHIDKKQADDLSNVTLQKGDVLLNITGGSVARCCIFPEEFLPARVNQHVSIVRPKQEIIDTSFLNYLLTSKFYKDQLLKIGEQGATRQAITKAQLEDFTIIFPKTLSEQKIIVNKLDMLSAESKKLEEMYNRKLDNLEELKKSVLKQAFSGGL